MRCSIGRRGANGCRRRKTSARPYTVITFLKVGVSVLLILGLSSCGNITSNARNGDIDEIARSLKEGVSIETRASNGATPPIVAAYSERTETVSFLLENGADINATDNNHCTAPIHAAY